MENYLTFYKDHVTIVKENNSHIIAKCFMCHEEKGHLYISKDTGQFHCKKCNNKGNTMTYLKDFKNINSKTDRLNAIKPYGIEPSSSSNLLTQETSGNNSLPIQSIMDGFNKYVEFAKENISEGQLKSLAKKRGLKVDILKKHNIGFDKYKKKYTIPIYTHDGKITDVRRYNPSPKDGQIKTLSSPKAKLGIFGIKNLLNRETVLIAEGEWDSMMLEGHGYNAIGICGTGHLPKRDIELFKNKDVTFCYDWDENGSGQKGVLVDAEKIKPHAKSIKYIEWPEEIIKDILSRKKERSQNDKSVDISDFFNSGYNKERFDQLLSESKTVSFDGKTKKKTEREVMIERLENTTHDKDFNLSQGFVDGVMYYAVRVEDEKFLITSEGELITFAQAKEHGLKANNQFPDIFRFSKDGILKCYKDRKKVMVSEIYKTIHDYIRKYIFFREPSTIKFLAVWVIGTYIFRVFRYYPYVWVNAEKRSGKTLLMEILKEISFNGGMSTSMTEAVIFRDVHNNSPTMFLDEMEKLGKNDKQVMASIMDILKTGFHRSGVAKRSASKNENFQPQTFSTFSPKMLAGIKDIDDVIQDRTIKVKMLRKKSGEVTSDYTDTIEVTNLQRNIRDDLYIFGLQYSNDISYMYNHKYDELQGTEHLENREKDIWQPIFTIANIIDIEIGNTELTDALSNFSKESSAERLEDDKDFNDTCKTLSALKDMLSDSGIEPDKTEGNILYFITDKVFDYFKNHDLFQWFNEKTTKSYLSKRLRKHVEIKTGLVWSVQASKNVRAYVIDIKIAEDFFERFIVGNKDLGS
jgi:DNA primase